MINKILSFITGQPDEQRQLDYHRALIRQEAQIGGQVFGPVPADRRREFFCLDKHTWIWHEEWTHQNGTRQSKTTRYDVRPSGILKAQENGTYHRVSEQEARNLIEASQIYIKRSLGELYGVRA